jgi:hypothetical protein
MLSGAPRLLVSRPGNDVLASIGNIQAMAFDSEWLALQNIHATGVSTSGAAIGDGFWRLCTWPSLGYLPIVRVIAQSRSWSTDFQFVGTPPETFRTRVYDGSIGVRQGDAWSGYSAPSVPMLWTVFAARAWQ